MTASTYIEKQADGAGFKIAIFRSVFILIPLDHAKGHKKGWSTHESKRATVCTWQNL